MTGATELPAWAALVTALLLVLGAGITLTGSLGLLRLATFYERSHAPTLGTSLGTACIALASILFFSVTQMRPAVHEMLILAFVTLTTPVTLMLLVSAALFRDRSEGTFHEPVNGDLPPEPAQELSEPDRVPSDPA